MSVRRLRIDGKCRGLIEHIHDHREIPLGCVAECRRAVQWIGDVEGGARLSTAPHASILREHLM